MILFKRNAKGDPISWSIHEWGQNNEYIVHYGAVGGHKHSEIIKAKLSRGNEIKSRIKAKRKEGYKEASELKDNAPLKIEGDVNLLNFLNTYLPKNNTTDDGFTLPMLAKVLKDNKPFDKRRYLGQYKINGVRCIIGAIKTNDLFNPIRLTYRSREGTDWTPKLTWMDEVIKPELEDDLLDAMLEEGACLDGELYLPGYKVNDINSFVKNEKLPQHYQLQYWCYDIWIESMSADSRRKLRYEKFIVPAIEFKSKDEHLNNREPLVILPTVDVINLDYAIFRRNSFIDLGFEGLILRNPNAEYQFGKRNQAMFKFKKVDDGKFIIVDITSEHKRSDLPLFVCRNDINDELFECSINKPQDVQREILIHKEKYIGKYMQVEFRARSGVNKVPFHARGINIVD